MRLSKIEIRGFRKLVDTSCFAYGKLTALVGPNEAGKSSLLHALLAMNDNEQIPYGDRPRNRSYADNHQAIRLRYRLEPDDLAALAEIDSPNKAVWYVLTKDFDGTLRSSVEPRLTRPSDLRRKAESSLKAFADTKAAKELERTEEGDGPGDLLEDTLLWVEGDDELDGQQLEHVARLAQLLLQSESRRGVAAGERLRSWHDEQQLERPSERARKLLGQRRPLFALFDDDTRSLASDYQLSEVHAEPPQSLANLAALADLSLSDLHNAVERQDIGAIETITERANRRLIEVFDEAWSQAPVTVRLRQDGRILRIVVSSEGAAFTSIAERSDGLKTFLALTAFAAQQGLEQSFILLIDEVEQHLHYDAQADTIRMLDRQELAKQVIYTTHSAGALPFDLGTGVRPVIPSSEVAGTSHLSNEFWASGPGLTPLLMAMGAAATAMAPSRYALLTEGATDMLLLPTLIREAIGADRLEYQVAPGIAQANATQLEGLELEAGRVAYVVDGDAAGTTHAKRLLKAGVPEGRILYLGGEGSGLVLEALLSAETFVALANETIIRKHGNQPRFTQKDLGLPQFRSEALSSWCVAHGLTPVSKTAIVTALLDERPARFLTNEGRTSLRRLHREVCRALGIPIGGT